MVDFFQFVDEVFFPIPPDRMKIRRETARKHNVCHFYLFLANFLIRCQHVKFELI